MDDEIISSDTDSCPPSDFSISSSLESSHGLQVAVERCPVCDYSKRPFYCRVCVNKGVFTHSKGTYLDRYVDKTNRLDIVTKKRNSILKKFEKTVQHRTSNEIKKQLINDCKERIELLKKALKAQIGKRETEMKNLEEAKRENQNRKNKKKNHQKKMNNISEYVSGATTAVDENIGKLQNIIDDLSLTRRQHVNDLKSLIFPLEIVTTMSDEGSLVASTASAIRDASHTAYIRGQWVYTDGSEEGNTSYRILEPSLPCNGDLSAYIIWVAERSESSDTRYACLRNPGHRISAALFYASQMTAILSSILDVPLPYKQNYSVFCGLETSEKLFTSQVACLNHNILYLCFSQGMSEAELIEPKNTLGNLFLLVNKSDIGRVRSFTVNTKLLQSAGEITHSTESEEDDDRFGSTNRSLDEDHSLPDGWEDVSTDFMDSYSRPVYVSNMASMTYPRQPSDPSLTASATGLVTSAAASFVSLFKTGKR